MTLEEAIERLENEASYLKMQAFSERAKAIELGREALKWIKAFRELDDFDTCDMLPGETEEEAPF